MAKDKKSIYDTYTRRELLQALAYRDERIAKLHRRTIDDMVQEKIDAALEQ